MRVRKGSGNLQNGKRNRQKSQIKKLQHKPLTKYRNRQVNPPIWGLPCLFFTCLPFSFAILAVWIQGALSRRLGNMYFHISRNKQIIRTRSPQGRTGSDYIGLVRVTRLELVRQRHTPLKRACLPIPAHSHMQYWVDRDRFNAVYYSIDRQESQALFDRFGENIPLLP